MTELRREDVQSAWFDTFDRDDWQHIVGFANAVVRIAAIRASLSADEVRRIADSVQERGRKHCSGEVLVFDRHNLERAIEAALAT